MANLYNLARCYTPTVGNGTLAVGNAVSPYLSFAQAGVVSGTVRYAITDYNPAFNPAIPIGSEIGSGTYNSGTLTLTRSVLKSSNGNLPLVLSGNAQVYITPAAEDIVPLTVNPSTLNAVPKFSNTTGGLQNSGVTIDTNNNLTVPGSAAVQLSTASTVSLSAINVSTAGQASLLLVGPTVSLGTSFQLNVIANSGSPYVQGLTSPDITALYWDANVTNWRSENSAITFKTLSSASYSVNVPLNVSANTATPSGGGSAAVLLFGTTPRFGIYFGSGAPSVVAAKGSLYIRSDGTSTNDRAYINTTGTAGWTNIVTGA